MSTSTVPGFAGTQEELDASLAEGLASQDLPEDEFWRSASRQTDAVLAEYKTARIREGFGIGTPA